MKIHIVQKGDTLWKLSKKYGVSFEELKQMNSQLSNPDMIMPGMKIKIPGSSGSVKKEMISPANQPGYGVKEAPIGQPVQPLKEQPSIQPQQPKEQPLIQQVQEQMEQKPLPQKEQPMVTQPPMAKEQPVVKEIIKEKPIVKEVIKEKPIIKEIIKEKPIIQEIIKEKQVPQPVMPEIDINNYFMVNMANVSVEKPPSPPPIPTLPKKVKPIAMKDISPVEVKPSKDVQPALDFKPSKDVALDFQPSKDVQPAPDFHPIHEFPYMEPGCMPVTPIMPGTGLCLPYHPGVFPQVQTAAMQPTFQPYDYAENPSMLESSEMLDFHMHTGLHGVQNQPPFAQGVSPAEEMQPPFEYGMNPQPMDLPGYQGQPSQMMPDFGSSFSQPAAFPGLQPEMGNMYTAPPFQHGYESSMESSSMFMSNFSYPPYRQQPSQLPTMAEAKDCGCGGPGKKLMPQQQFQRVNQHAAGEHHFAPEHQQMPNQYPPIPGYQQIPSGQQFAPEFEDLTVHSPSSSDFRDTFDHQESIDGFQGFPDQRQFNPMPSEQQVSPGFHQSPDQQYSQFPLIQGDRPFDPRLQSMSTQHPPSPTKQPMSAQQQFTPGIPYMQGEQGLQFGPTEQPYSSGNQPIPGQQQFNPGFPPMQGDQSFGPRFESLP
ncbi:hypothetical protein CUU64_20200, partial [Bacillus sp. V5-8f]